MRKVFLITGFNNWGKTRILTQVFQTKVFRKGLLHTFAGKDFLVLPKSNDDLGFDGYIEHYEERLEAARDAGHDPRYIASAFCPTKEIRNYSPSILRKIYPKDQIEMILLEYKWCGHAKLRLNEIEQFYAGETNVRIHRVHAAADPARHTDVGNIMQAHV